MTWISEIFLRNYKPFGEIKEESWESNIRLGQLTLLFGRNGSGKSSILEAIALAAQNAAAAKTGDVWSNSFLEGGSMVSYPSKEYAFHGKDMGRELGIGFSLSTAGGELEEHLQAKGISVNKKLDLTRIHYYYGFFEEQMYRGKRSSKPNRQGLWLGQPPHETNLFTAWMEISPHKSGGWSNSSHMSLPVAIDGEDLGTPLAPSFLSVHRIRDASTNEKHRSHLLLCSNVIEFVRDYMGDHVYYLKANRGDVLSDDRTDSSGRGVDRRVLSVHTRGQRAINVLALLAGPKGSPEDWKSVIRWCGRFGLGEFNAGHGEEKPEAAFTDPDNRTKLDVRVAGLGSRQMLGVLAQCFAAPSSSVIMVEEPENNLHMEAQAQLPGFFADVIARGVQLIVTTHSKLLVNAMRHAVRKKKLRVDRLKIYDLDKKKGGIDVRPVDIREDGTIPEWIPSFTKVEKKLFEEWSEEE